MKQSLQHSARPADQADQADQADRPRVGGGDGGDGFATDKPDASRPVGRELTPPVGLIAGIGCGMAAAVLYTLSNIALRDSVGINPFLVSAVKAAPTVICLTH